MTFERLLCATDLLETGNHATEVAIALARAIRASVTLAHSADVDVLAAYEQSAGFASAARDQLVARLRERIDVDRKALDATRDRAIESGVACDVAFESGRPWEAIVRIAERVRADLIVVGAHSARTQSPRILGSTADRVVRHAKQPVLVTSGSGPASFDRCRIVVGADFSTYSAHAIRVAGELARATRAAVDLVHVLPLGGFETERALLGDIEAAAHAELERCAREQAVEASHHVVLGNAADALADFCARTDADVLVVGRRGHSRLGELLLGSTTERALRRSPVPVLVT
jgi:nucleotide-binding universal stress UspA family protein